MKRLNPRPPAIPFTALALAALIGLMPVAVRAQNDFRVTNATGLELDGGAPKSATKKTKPSPVGEKKATEITCDGETTFDAKAGMAVFVKNVKVTDPQFSLVTEKLTAYLKKAVKETVKNGVQAAAAPNSNPVAAKLDDAAPASGLERAVAEGGVVISQDKVDEKTGEVTRYIGRGAKADYNAATGEMILSGWPQIQQGLNNQVATEEGTIMIMNRDGHLTTKGGTKTVIQSDSKPAKSEKSAASQSPTPGLIKLP